VIDGDNSVQALYQKTNKVALDSPPQEWLSILFYFYFAEINHHFPFLRQLIQHLRYFLSKILRFLLGDSAVDAFKRRFSKI
jgi:hypothetical protein